MLKCLKKSLVFLTVIATILWAMGAPLVPLNIAAPQVQAASLAVQFDGNQPMYMIPWNGSILPSSSQPAGLFAFHLKRTNTAVLTNIKINLIGTAENTDIASLALYKRTDFSSGGMGYSFPSADRIGNQTTINAFSSGVSANNIIDVTQDGTKNAIGTDFWGAEYVVAVATSAAWSGTDKVSYTLSADWITVSDGALGPACPASGSSCQPQTDFYYAGTDAGFSGMGFAIENVENMGEKGDGTKEVNVRFTSEVETISATTALNYAVGATAPTAVTLMTPRSVSLIFASAVTITPNQTVLIIKGPGGVNGGVKNTMGSGLTADVNMTIMGGGGAAGGSPLLISEIMIGTAADPLKEFVELYNPSSSAVNFANMGIKLWVTSYSGNTVTHTKVIDITTGTIAVNGYFLIASSQYADISPAANATYDASVGGAEGRLQANRGIYISTNNSQNIGIINKLGWGSALGEMSDGPAKCTSGGPDSCTVGNDGKSLERKANPQATAATMILTSAGTDGKYGNSYMSMNNQYDLSKEQPLIRKILLLLLRLPAALALAQATLRRIFFISHCLWE